MQNYSATVRIRGQSVKTLVHAESQIHARLILQYLYGMSSVVGSPVVAETIHSNTPKTPEQQRLASLQANKRRAADALAAERQRQKITKAQQALRTATSAAKPKPQPL